MKRKVYNMIYVNEMNRINWIFIKKKKIKTKIAKLEDHQQSGGNKNGWEVEKISNSTLTLVFEEYIIAFDLYFLLETMELTVQHLY